jgi:hypothetical protein
MTHRSGLVPSCGAVVSILGLTISAFLGLLLAVAVVFVVWVSIFIVIFAPSEKETIKKYEDTQGGPSWTCLSQSHSLGDDDGDDFLEEAGLSNIYKSTNILELAEGSSAGKKFLKRYAHIPSWVNLERLQVGIDFQRLWISNVISSGIGAIIESFGYSNGANILMETGRLCGSNSEVTKRLVETAYFNICVITHGLALGSPAVETIARVRILHCAVRRHVRNSCPGWDVSSQGCPVSQMDGIHTILLNSLVTVRALELQGIYATHEEKAGVSMVWAYVAYLLGINEEFLPKTFSEERGIYHTLFNHSFCPNDVSYKLTNATLAGASNIPPYNFSLGQQAAIARLSLGTKLSNALRISKPARANEYLLIWMIRFSAVSCWLLNKYIGWKVFAFDVKYMNNQVNNALIIYCGGKANWRFLLARKKR